MSVPPHTPDLAWLERANRLALIARMVSTTVHDVNNALQVISGSAELLELAPGASEAVLRRGQSVAAQAKRASALLIGLSTFVRDTRSLPEQLGLRLMAEQVVAMRQYSLTKLLVTSTVSGDEVTVTANPRELQQVLMNLVINAERALGQVPGARLTVEIARDGDTAVVAVEDNGAGVSAATEGELFAPRLQDPGEAGDLGIGLAVSRALAARMAGTLSYAPADPRGARFSLRLPASGR